MSENLLAVASDVCTRIYEAGDFDFVDNRFWYDLASSQIALIAGDSKILYIDHDINTAHSDNTTAKIVAFTEDVVIIVDLTFSAGSTRNGRNLGARVIGRRELSAFTVSDVTNAIGYTQDDWPKKASVTVTYGDETFTLPFRSYGPAGLQVAQLAGGLAKDLNG